MIADTTFLIDLARGDAGAAQKMSELKLRREPLAITALTVFELFQGSHGLSLAELKIFSTLVHNAMVIEIEHEIAKSGGAIRSYLRKKGKVIEAIDSMIAATALIGNDIILTRNVKDFSEVEGLKIETY